MSAYVGNGLNRWPAVHRLDAARLFRLALEKNAIGARYNGVGDSGIPVKTIAELIGKQLQLPVGPITADEAFEHFEWMSRFIVFDNPASSTQTETTLGWTPQHIGLLEDMKANYFG